MPQALYARLKRLSEENLYPLPGYIRHVLTEHVWAMEREKNE